MKLAVFRIATLFAAAGLARADSEPPSSAELSRAAVTIPYTELRALWRAAHPAKRDDEAKPPPVQHVVERADSHLQLGEKVSTLDALFELESLHTGWQTIPLLGGDVQLEKAEPSEPTIIWDKGYAMLTNQPGPAQLSLRFSTTGIKELVANRPLRLQFGTATVKTLRVSGVPAGLEARLGGLTGRNDGDGLAVFSLPGAPGDLNFELIPPKVQKPVVPSVWTIQSQILVVYREGRVHYQARLFAHADGGAGSEISLRLPANAGGVIVVADDLADWTNTRLEDGRRLLYVRWKTPEILDRELTISYAAPQSPLAEQWQLNAPAIPDENASRHLFAVVPSDGLELKADGLRAGVAAHRLPQWLRTEIGGAPFFTAEGGPQLLLQAHWLPTIATAEAVVTEAKTNMRIVADGSLQVNAAYAVRHSEPLAWQIELLAGVEILSCTVDGKPARPLRRDEATIEVPLPMRTEKETPTSVAIQYVGQSQPFDAVSGQTALTLPRIPLFIERLEWVIAIPEKFEISAIDGNVAVASRETAGSPASVHTIHLRKDLCRGERPAVDLFYQRRGLDN